MSDEDAIEVGDVREPDESTPRYVHRLLDALLRHEPLNFQSCEVPAAVNERIAAYFADRKDMTTRLDIADSNSLANLNGLLAAAIGHEMGGMVASDDFAWQRMSLGVLGKMGARQVGWSYLINDHAHLFMPIASYPEAPDDDRLWVAVFAFGN